MMNNTEKQTKFRLKLYFFIALAISVICFLLTVAYTQKYNIIDPNIVLERYGVLLTLVGIPLALKMFHSKSKKLDRSVFDVYLKKYEMQSIIRLGILLAVCFFNMTSLFITGSKNFYFMVIITIFAFFLCFPQKAQLTPESEDIEQ